MAYSKFSIFLGRPPAQRGLIAVPHESALHGNHYDPHQPRVPAGHRDGGQWTRNGSPSNDQLSSRDEPPWRNVFSDLIPDNMWLPGADYAGGNDSNIQHKKGVDAAIDDYFKRGYHIARSSAVAVDVPGFATPRFYDFIVEDPKTGYLIGIEVKTTLSDTIRLNPDQAAKDVVVVQQGGRVRVGNWTIRGVGYITYCFGCEAVDFRSVQLHSTLSRFNIPFTHGGTPGETLP